MKRITALLCAGTMLLVSPLCILAKEVVPNSTVTSYKHGGLGGISETYTPPANHEFKRINPGHITEYFNWTPQDLFELQFCDENARQIQVDLVNGPNTPDLFIGTLDGELVRSSVQAGRGGGESENPTWVGEIKGIAIEITDAPHYYYAAAESHVPVVFKVNLPEGDDRQLSSPDEVIVENVVLQVGESFLQLSTQAYSVYPGDLYNRSDPNDPSQKNVFSVLVKQELFDAITISPEHVTGEDQAIWVLDVSVKAADDTVVRCGEYLTDDSYAAIWNFTLGDNTIPIYELTMGRSTTNGRYDVTQQEKYRKTHKADFFARTPLDHYYTRTSNFNWGELTWGTDQEPTATRTGLQIQYDTDSKSFMDGFAMEFSLMDERRGGCVVFQEGRSTVSVAGGGTIEDVFDPTRNSEQLGFELFTDENGLQCMTYEYGQTYGFDYVAHNQDYINSRNTTIAGFCLSVGSLAVALVTAIPSGGVSLVVRVGAVAVSGAGVAVTGTDVAHRYLASDGEEWAEFYFDGAWAVQPRYGNVGAAADRFNGLSGPTIHRVNSASATTAYAGWAGKVSQSAGKVYKPGDSLSAYISISLKAGSPSGTYGLPPALFDYQLDAKAVIDISQDKYIDLLP